MQAGRDVLMVRTTDRLLGFVDGVRVRLRDAQLEPALVVALGGMPGKDTEELDGGESSSAGQPRLQNVSSRLSPSVGQNRPDRQAHMP